MAALNHAVKLPKLKLGKVGRFDRDRRVIRRNDPESVAMIDRDLTPPGYLRAGGGVMLFRCPTLRIRRADRCS